MSRARFVAAAPLLLLLLVLGAGTVASQPAGFESARYRSRKGRLVFDLADSTAWFLLEPGSTFDRQPGGLDRPHRLVQGTLLISNAPGADYPAPANIALEQARAVFRGGEFVIEALPGHGEVVHVIRGEAGLRGAWGQHALRAGQSLILRRGARPGLAATPEGLGRTHARAFADLARSPIPRRLGDHFAGALLLDDGEKRSPYLLTATTLDRRLSDPQVRTWLSYEQELEVPGASGHDLSFMVPEPTSMATLRGSTESAEREVLTVAAGRIEGSPGEDRRIVNRLVAPEDGHVRSLVDGQTLLASGRGGVLEITRDHDPEGNPRGPIRYLFPTGYAFLEESEDRAIAMATARRSGFPERQFRAVQTEKPTVHGLVLLQGRSASPSDMRTGLANFDAQTILGLPFVEPAIPPTEPVASFRLGIDRELYGRTSRTLTTLSQLLPLSMEDLLTFFPIHSSAWRPGHTVGLALRRERVPGDDDGVSSWLLVFESLAFGGAAPSVEVFLDPVDRIAQKPTRIIGRIAFFHGDSAFNSARNVIERGSVHVKGKGGRYLLENVERLGKASDALVVLFIGLVIMSAAWMAHRRRSEASFQEEAPSCPHCGKPMDAYVLVTGEPGTDVEVFEALAVFEVERQAQDARELARRLAPYRRRAPDRRSDDALWYGVEVQYCFRCTAGVLATRVRRGAQMLDEAQIDFQGQEVFEPFKALA